MSDVRVQIDPGYLVWLGAAPDSPLNVVLDATADLLLEAAKARAPVSPRGSRYAPPGFTRERVIVAEKDHDDNGELIRFIGTRTNRRGGANSYPWAFFSNDAGMTWNRGHKSKRKAADYFLAEALEEIPYLTYEV